MKSLFTGSAVNSGILREAENCQKKLHEVVKEIVLLQGVPEGETFVSEVLKLKEGIERNNARVHTSSLLQAQKILMDIKLANAPQHDKVGG